MLPNYMKRELFTTSSVKTLILSFSVTVILITVKKVHAYGEGAPVRTCESMIPFHAEQSMIMDMPFDISIDKKIIRGTGKITIQVVSKNPSRYSLRGALFVMKQPNNKGSAFGTFDPALSAQHLKTIACFGKPGSGITHFHREPKTMLIFQWNAPNDTSAEYELHATLVRDYNSFWADYVHPERIRVRANATSTAVLMNLHKPLLLAAVAAFFIVDC